MAPQKAIDGKYAPTGAIPVDTTRMYALAASIANLLVAMLVFVVFSAMAIVGHDGGAIQIGPWLVPFVTLVVWSADRRRCGRSLAHCANEPNSTYQRILRP